MPEQDKKPYIPPSAEVARFNQTDWPGYGELSLVEKAHLLARLQKITDAKLAAQEEALEIPDNIVLGEE